MPRLFPIAALLALASCALPATAPPPEDMQAACGAAELQGLVGQPASALDALKFSQPVRVIRPGMAVTMDYSPVRLNIELDSQERISRIACG